MKDLATWSIVIVDPVTKEVAIGSATCLTNFDLEHASPVVLVDIGGACYSRMVDRNAQGVSVRFQAVQVPGCDRRSNAEGSEKDE